jgi:hypothetical protein
MFKPYRIVDNADVKGAMAQRGAYEGGQMETGRADGNGAGRIAGQAALAARKAADEAARLASAAQLAEAAAISARLQ